MNIMDRFLSVVRIRKNQLQLLGAVCLFLASKLRQTRPLEAEKLVLYTDFSVNAEEIVVSNKREKNLLPVSHPVLRIPFGIRFSFSFRLCVYFVLTSLCMLSSPSLLLSSSLTLLMLCLEQKVLDNRYMYRPNLCHAFHTGAGDASLEKEKGSRGREKGRKKDLRVYVIRAAGTGRRRRKRKKREAFEKRTGKSLKSSPKSTV